jgi:hypothetical protein
MALKKSLKLEGNLVLVTEAGQIPQGTGSAEFYGSEDC